MKIILVLLLTFFTFIFSVFSQSNQNVEARIKLIQQFNGVNISGLTIGISVINHNNKNLFIPNFSFLQIHVYEKTDTGWREMDIYSNSYYDLEYDKSGKRIASEAAVLIPKNKTTLYFKDSVNLVFKRNDSIITRYCIATKQFAKQWITVGSPLFLKANEEIDKYRFYAVDNLVTTTKEYKITFGNQKKDEWYMKGKFAEISIKLPDKIFDYEFYKGNLNSNTIYYSTLPIDLKNKL